MAHQTLVDQGLVIKASQLHCKPPSIGLVISQTQRPVPDRTQHPQERHIHTPGGIRTRISSKRTDVDPHLRPCGHWDR